MRDGIIWAAVVLGSSVQWGTKRPGPVSTGDCHIDENFLSYLCDSHSVQLWLSSQWEDNHNGLISDGGCDHQLSVKYISH